MKVVAVTGGIGSGKSVVCRMLSQRGIPVYDSDSATKKLYAKDDSLLDAIEEAFGCSIRQADGTLDKAKLSSIIFTSADRLKTLEAIVHPAVLRDFMKWTAMQESKHAGESASPVYFGKQPFAVIESAIILSKPEFLKKVNAVVLVDASLSVRLRRVCERDDVSEDKVIQRMAAQKFDISKVNAIIRNDGTEIELKKAVEAAFVKLPL